MAEPRNKSKRTPAIKPGLTYRGQVLSAATSIDGTRVVIAAGDTIVELLMVSRPDGQLDVISDYWLAEKSDARCKRG